MDVLICTNKQGDEWGSTLEAFLPDACVHVGADSPECDYAVLWQPPASLFERQPRLKAMFSLGAGVNGLLANPSLPRDVPLVRMEDGGMAAQMVEYALYVALREFRRFPGYRQNQLQSRWEPQPPRARLDFRIGVLGLGVLGGVVARELADFGFDVAGWSRGPKAVPGVDCRHGPKDLDAVLARSQMLLLFLPVTDATHGLLDRVRLALLPAGAVVVNLSRGELVEDGALLEELDAGRVAAAYLDVFQQEPLPPDHAFWQHPRVRITPHVAALTDTRLACRQIADKIRCLEAGEPISGVVDRFRGY